MAPDRASPASANVGEARALLARGAPKIGATAPASLTGLALAALLWGFPEVYRQVDVSEDHEGRRIIESVAEEASPNAIVIQHRSHLHHVKLVEAPEDVVLWGFDRPNDGGKAAEALRVIREERLHVVPSEGK